jgi:hypothetical protein
MINYQRELKKKNLLFTDYFNKLSIKVNETKMDTVLKLSPRIF